MVVRLLTDIVEVRAAHVRSRLKLGADFVSQDSRVLLVEKAPQGLVSFGERPGRVIKDQTAATGTGKYIGFLVQGEPLHMPIFRVKSNLPCVACMREKLPRNNSTVDIPEPNISACFERTTGGQKSCAP